MPLGQFDERVTFLNSIVFDDTYVAGTWTTAFTGLRDLRLDVVQAVSDDTIDNYLEADFFGGSGSSTTGEVKIPISSGYGGTDPVDCLAFWFPTSFHFVVVPTNVGFQFRLRSQPSSGKKVTVTFYGGGF